jgi:hypothetical protein
MNSPQFQPVPFTRVCAQLSFDCKQPLPTKIISALAQMLFAHTSRGVVVLRDVRERISTAYAIPPARRRHAREQSSLKRQDPVSFH